MKNILKYILRKRGEKTFITSNDSDGMPVSINTPSATQELYSVHQEY
jgi:hypothetical protein